MLEEGLTIGGKKLREHFEVVNHSEAIDYVKEIVQRKAELSEFVVKSVHQLILKNIDDENAGIYRKINVMIEPFLELIAGCVEDSLRRYIGTVK